VQVLAPQKEDKIPGNVQPDTELFAVPGDVEIRTKEINNGEMMMRIMIMMAAVVVVVLEMMMMMMMMVSFHCQAAWR
jgi:hypothetical protein